VVGFSSSGKYIARMPGRKEGPIGHIAFAKAPSFTFGARGARSFRRQLRKVRPRQNHPCFVPGFPVRKHQIQAYASGNFGGSKSVASVAQDQHLRLSRSLSLPSSRRVVGGLHSNQQFHGTVCSLRSPTARELRRWTSQEGER
jgi:hypothetical protein